MSYSVSKFKEIAGKFKVLNKKPIVALSHIEDVVTQVRALTASMAPLNRLKEEYKTQIAEHMQDNAFLLGVDGNIIVEWDLTSDKKEFDLLAFKEDFPDLYEMYCFTKEGTRVMRMK